MATSQRQEIELNITRLEDGDAARPQRAVVEIETRKHYNGGLVSAASVYWVGQSSRSQCIALGSSGGDFSKRLSVSARTVKATQKAIDTQHAAVFTPELVAGIVADAKAHYASAIEAGEDGFNNTYTR